MDSTGFITRGGGLGGSARRNTTSSAYGALSLAEFKKIKRQEEKDRVREAHYTNLIVRHNENVDGGFLAPYGTYKSNLDYHTDVVRGLIIARRLSPFYTPLQDFDEDWSDEELLILLRQLTLHTIESAYVDEEEEDDIDNHKIHKSANYYRRQELKTRLKMLIEKVKEEQKEEENKFLEAKMAKSLDVSSLALLLRLYRNALECPICFVFYPQNLNMSRCCVQPICTECFVQIKRLDPHPAHGDEEPDPKEPHSLISEPANCPYCALPEFGVTYDAPKDLGTGIGGIKPGLYGQGNLQVDKPTVATHTRRKSHAANSLDVILVDEIRPDWEQKLIAARSKLARKAATASAIHASNLLIPGENNRQRSFEDRLIEEAMRLSILDEEERKRKEAEEKKKKDEGNKR